ncbi:50S ribosomal protein L10 [Planctomicrobium piriforme]|uniref:Large ribosomal subunit protein uL10 n=1 Tax=Planctomicrobium piriforme TaxID=1576369 RepID=A0A1I3B9H2_9PLAN|nr:50S ribosomal protein L10 [Planctomicrobium piriforme]SFH58820.1 large subunit ribosomal protein L10 [Planctomicrobium piriforme]
MSKPVKEMIIREIRAELGSRKDLLMLDVSKMDAIAQNQLRETLRKKGVTLLGVKNSLAKLALKESGIDVSESILSGPTTLVWGSEDIVGLSREMTEWAKKIEKMSIKGGVVDGQGVNSDGVEEISKGPSRLELIGQIAGLLLSPGAKLAGALLGPGGTISGQLTALSEKGEDEAKEGGDAA